MLAHDVIKRDFPVLGSNFNGKPLIYFDNAASTQKPRSVVEALSEFYQSSYANVHRSPHSIGDRATQAFEDARKNLARFIGATDHTELVFTSGTTASINMVAQILSQQMLQTGDVILTTPFEHHSNLVPWQMAARMSGASLKFIEGKNPGVFDLDSVRENWDPKTKVFAFQHVSNVFGTIHQVKELCEIAAENGAVSVIDGAQAVPHIPVDVKAINCDFYAFSGHKMLGPTGIGALYGKREHLERVEPVWGGGEMISKVRLYHTDWNVPPYKFEPGTPNIAGAIGLNAAVKYLQQTGMKEINNCIEGLSDYTINRMKEVEGLTVYGPAVKRSAAISFNIDGIHAHDLASIMDHYGIAIRAGHHCAEPLMEWLDVSATARASLYFYNTTEEIDKFIEALKKAKEIMRV